MTVTRRQEHVKVVDVAVHLPADGRTTAQVEARLAELNPGLEVPAGMIERFTGVRYRHIAPDGWTASDLAVAAARKLLASCRRDIAEVDLIIFAATSMETIEPATGHIVAAKLGARCPVFDLKNACNSVVNAIEVASDLIRGGRYARVLIACGELVNPATQWRIRDLEELVTAGVSHTISDAGAALLLETSDTPGVLAHRFMAESAAWDTTAVRMTYERNVDGFQVESFRVKSMELMAALEKTDPAPLLDEVTNLGLTMDDFAVICIHQAALPYLWEFCERVGVPKDKTVVSIADHGNVAAATLPLQLVEAVRTGRLRRGDLVALFGLASGLSLGIVVLRW